MEIQKGLATGSEAQEGSYFWQARECTALPHLLSVVMRHGWHREKPFPHLTELNVCLLNERINLFILPDPTCFPLNTPYSVHSLVRCLLSAYFVPGAREGTRARPVPSFRPEPNSLMVLLGLQSHATFLFYPTSNWLEGQFALVLEYISHLSSASNSTSTTLIQDSLAYRKPPHLGISS